MKIFEGTMNEWEKEIDSLSLGEARLLRDALFLLNSWPVFGQLFGSLGTTIIEQMLQYSVRSKESMGGENGQKL